MIGKVEIGVIRVIGLLELLRAQADRDEQHETRGGADQHLDKLGIRMGIHVSFVLSRAVSRYSSSPMSQ